MTENLRAEDHQVRKEDVGEFQIRITSYRLGSEWICHVDNVDPGATVARAKASTREEAEESAVSRARKAVSNTRTYS
ncbi:MAG: hypothetical protein JKX97_05795 [Candidatus Lindowbacteria bacterium]|nr:hypothetical protein [Candidatus Lindowbacteria bacterium]